MSERSSMRRLDELEDGEIKPDIELSLDRRGNRLQIKHEDIRILEARALQRRKMQKAVNRTIRSA